MLKSILLAAFTLIFSIGDLSGDLYAAERDLLQSRVPPDKIGEVKKIKSPFQATAENIQKGKKIFEGKGTCFTCHGMEGKGDGPAAVGLDPSPRDFTSAAFQAARAVHLCPIEIEVIKQTRINLDAEVAGYLEVTTAPKEVISRKAWLKKDRQRLLYASTILYASSTPAIQSAVQPAVQSVVQSNEGLLGAILDGKKPLGTLIDEQRLPSFKDKVQIGPLLYPEIAQALGLAPATELWGRHYRLVIPGHVRASVLEIFSPAAFCATR